MGSLNSNHNIGQRETHTPGAGVAVAVAVGFGEGVPGPRPFGVRCSGVHPAAADVHHASCILHQ